MSIFAIIIITNILIGMKKLLLLTFFALAFVQAKAGDGDIEINETNFPDAVFRTYLLEQSYGQDGVMTSAEIAEVKSIWVSESNIESLKGIEFFTALESLYCQRCKVKTLDVSNNTALKILYCDENQLPALDVSKNLELKEMACGYNPLNTLDVSNNTKLTLLYCNANQLKTLDLSNNTALTELWCWNNKLTSLDVSKNIVLRDLMVSGNPLRTLDLSKNTELLDLECYNNQLTALDVTKNTKLVYIECGANNLKTLDVSQNPELGTLWVTNNQLTAIDLSHNPELEYFGCGMNQLTALDVSNNPKLVELYCYANHFKGESMDALIASMATVESSKFFVKLSNNDDPNMCTSQQIAAVKAKGWIPCYYDRFTNDWQVMTEYQTTRQHLLSKTVGDATYSLYGEMLDKYHIHTNPDGMRAYLSTLTLDVTKGDETKTYLLDDQIFLETAIGDAGRPCMSFDMDAQQMYVFCISGDDYYDYGIEGYFYSSPMGDMNFTKEVVFTRTNQGQYCNFMEMRNGKLGLNFFRYAGYYAMTAVRNAPDSWSIITNQYIEYPYNYASLWQKQDNALVFGQDYSPVTEQQYLDALEAIPARSKYYIYTMYDTPEGPKKFYLNSQGLLSDTPDDKPFTFTETKSSSSTILFASPGRKVNSSFSNPKLMTEATGDINHMGGLMKDSKARSDWEGQVWYKDGDRYAVRATNAVALVWGAGTYWTVMDSNRDGFPEADYALTPNFVWQIEDPSETSIHEIASGKNNASRTVYNLSGQTVSKPSHGVNIIRTNDGKTRKVLVK